jgi:hypothetical protein
MSGEMGNLVVKVNVKKNVEEGSMMASVELLEASVSSSKVDSVLDKANGVIRVDLGLSEQSWCIIGRNKPKLRWEADEEVFG